MRSFVLSAAITLVLTGASAAQTTQVVRGASADQAKKTTSTKPAAAQKPAAQTPQAVQGSTTPQTLRGSRYGGCAPSAPPTEPPPDLDTRSPRTISLINVNSTETLTVTYWSGGTYHRDALNQLNRFLRDNHDNAQTEMDPLLFDVLWHTMQIAGYSGPVEVLSAFRSQSTNAWLASVSRGVARDSQHINGNAMDVRFPGMPVFKMRQAARSLQMGGVGYYPRSGFVHLDTGPIRYW